MWGWSPADGTFGTGTMPVSQGGEAARHAHRLRRSTPDATSRQLADEHIFIRPVTDAAALIAMAYVIVSEGLHDQAYLRPPRARLRRGAPAAEVRRPARPIARICWADATAWRRRRSGPRRSPASRPRRCAGSRSSSPPPSRRRCRPAMRPAARRYGEQFHRAAYALAAITGNVGIPGGSSGASNGATGRCGHPNLPTGTNPIDARVAIAAACRSARARQSRRLSGRHQADLFVGRRSVQPVPQRQQDASRRSTAWSSLWRRTTS